MDKELRILILEDIPADAELEEHELRKAGLVFTSKVVDTREAFLKELDEFFPDLILSDYELPLFDGIAALRIAKEKCPDVPFILVTGKLGEEFAIEKLKKGATDYVLKNNLKRLVPSVKRALEEAKQITERKRAELEYKTILHTAMDCFYVVNTHGRILDANDSYCSMTGYSIDELLRINLNDIEAIETEEIIAQRMRRIIEVGWDRFETRHKCKDGRIVEIEASVNYVKDGIGKFFVFMRDITDRKQAEESLRESEEKYRSLVESTEDSIYLVDRNYTYLFMNKKHISRMGFSGNEYLGKEYGEFHSPDETKWFIEKISKVFNIGESVRHEYKSLRDSRYFLQTVSPVKTSDGTIVAVTVISKDITDYKIMEEKLQSLSLIDELTGLHNRRGLFALVEQLLKLCKRQKKGTFMLYADVDNLKEINDTFGHKEGDMALKDIADILRKNFRDADIIARIGGDEFVVIPVGAAGDNVETISSRLQKSLEFHNAERNHSYKLSLSFGIAYYDPENPCSIDGLLIQGDELMYEQKRHKHNS